MRIKLNSIIVDNQDKALKFYTVVAIFDDSCGNFIQIFQALIPTTQP